MKFTLWQSHPFCGHKRDLIALIHLAVPVTKTRDSKGDKVRSLAADFASLHYRLPPADQISGREALPGTARWTEQSPEPHMLLVLLIPHP